MSNMLRKYKRSIFKENHPRCCGQKMERKAGYDMDTQAFYFCEICGKEKYVPKEYPNLNIRMEMEQEG